MNPYDTDAEQRAYSLLVEFQRLLYYVHLWPDAKRNNKVLGSKLWDATEPRLERDRFVEIAVASGGVLDPYRGAGVV